MAFGEFMKKLTNPNEHIGANAERAKQILARANEQIGTNNIPKINNIPTPNKLPEDLQKMKNILISKNRPPLQTNKWFK